MRGGATFRGRAVDGTTWNFGFGPEGSGPFAIGSYVDAERFGFATAGHPGLDISGAGKGCNMLTGSFTVHELEIVDGDVQRIRVTFEQHCEGRPARLFGCFAFTEPP